MSKTAQEVFNTVAAHLLKQGAASIGPFGCQYRGRDGAQCAVGCLIPDEEYNKAIEGTSVLGLINERTDICPPSLTALAEHKELLRRLQCVHDTDVPAVWRRALAVVAEDYELNPEVLNG